MADTKVSLPDISTIQPDRLIKYRISEDRFSAEVLLPGLAYTDFDRKIGGKLTLWSLNKLFESVRWVGFMFGFMFYPEIVRDKRYIMFVASCAQEFTMDIQSIEYSSHWGKHFPLRFEFYIAHIGTTSFTVSVDMFDHDNGVKIAYSLITIVNIDANTRKPTALPDFLRKPSSKFHQPKRQKIAKPSKPVIPENAFRYQVKVLYSDCDFNHHANQAMYTRWCTDAGTLAACAGRYRHFSNNIELYPIQSVANQHTGEALTNDIITVVTWQDSDTPTVLHFLITNCGKSIFNAKFKYYDCKPAVMPRNFKTSKL